MAALGAQAQVLMGQQTMVLLGPQALPVVVALRQAEPVPLAPPMVQARMMVLAQRAPPQVMRQPARERWVALERE